MTGIPKSRVPAVSNETGTRCRPKYSEIGSGTFPAGSEGVCAANSEARI